MLRQVLKLAIPFETGIEIQKTRFSLFDTLFGSLSDTLLGSFWDPFGNLWDPLGLLLDPLGLLLDPLGLLLDPFGLLGHPWGLMGASVPPLWEFRHILVDFREKVESLLGDLWASTSAKVKNILKTRTRRTVTKKCGSRPAPDVPHVAPRQ